MMKLDAAKEKNTHTHTQMHRHTFESQVMRRVPPKRGTGPRSTHTASIKTALYLNRDVAQVSADGDAFRQEV